MRGRGSGGNKQDPPSRVLSEGEVVASKEGGGRQPRSNAEGWWIQTEGVGGQQNPSISHLSAGGVCVERWWCQTGGVAVLVAKKAPPPRI